MKKKWIRDAIHYGVKTKTWKIMRLSAFFLFLFISQVWAGSGYAQQTKLTMKMENAKVIDVLDEIENNSEFYFLFNQKLVDVDRKVDVDAKEKTIDNILTDLFAETDVHHQVKDRLIILTTEKSGYADVLNMQQQKSVSGKVTDNAGLPLPGVSIVIKGTTNGTITDFDGKYTMGDVPTDATLVFSFVGMKTQEISFAGKSSIDVIMEENAIGMDEVVVIGYGTQKKENLTAAVEMVDVNVLKNRPVKNVGEMLAGSVPNLNITKNSGAPDATESFNIRGFTGFGSSGAPLILVDGVEQNINNVNANDIESVSVLKDAAASAIYGSRAPYGVILITTKSGKKGNDTRINYSFNFNINTPTYMPSNVNGLEFVRLRNMMGYNSGQPQWYSDENMEKIQAYLDGDGPSNQKVANGQWADYINATGSTDFYAEAFRKNSTDMTHNLDVSGGTDKTTYYMGLGYQEKEGVYNTELDNYDRMSTILKVKTDIADWVSVSMNTRYSRTTTLRPNFTDQDSGSGTDSAILSRLGYFPNHPTHNPDGSIHFMNNLIALYGLTGEINNKSDDFWAIPSIELKLFEGFRVRSSFSWNSYNQEATITNFIATTDRGNGTITKFNYSSNNESYKQSLSRKNYYQFEANAEYKKQFGNHSLLFLTGFQQEYGQYNNVTASRNDFYTTEVPSFSTTYGDVMSIDDRIYDWATRGFYFRGSYNYQGKYLLDFNSRYDASSRYAEDARWAFFPSVSIGYNIARENFWPSKKINTFKLTGSWGKSGNQDTGTSNSALYTYLPTLGTGTLSGVVLGGSLQPYVTLPPLLSSDLTWSKPRSIGFGIELGVFNNRLQSEYRWYQRTIFDQVSPPETLPVTLGTSVPPANNGVSETRGWEFSVSWKDKAFNIMGDPLSYGVRGMVSDYIGYVVDYGDPNIAGIRNTWTPGEVFGIEYGYHSNGIATSAEFMANNVPADNGWYYHGDLYFQDKDGDGRIGSGDGSVWYTEGDRIKLGYNYPRYRYSFVLDAGWKNWDLNILLDGVGHQVKYINNSSIFGYLGSSWSSGNATAFTIHEDLGGYWTADNPDAFFPRIYQNEWSKNSSRANDQYALNLSHLRIKNINLSYQLPAKWVNKLRFANASLNLSIENAGFIYNSSWLKFDPANLSEGARSYPLQRVVSFGVKIGIL